MVSDESRSSPISAHDGGRIPRRLAFMLVPEFSMMAFTAAIEPLRAANRMSGARLYSWRTFSIDGGPVTASNAVKILPDAPISEIGDPDSIVVCAGLNAAAYGGDAILAALRRAARHGVALGSVCTGTVILAKAGLLDGYRCTIHWEDLDSFAETFPELDVSSRLYEIDRDRFTCAGGTAPLDMMIHFIELGFGLDLAVRVADQMLHHFTRKTSEPQRLALTQRTGVRHPGLLAAIAQMEAHLENPVPLSVIAAQAGLSGRQLERLFATLLGAKPARYYRDLRLNKARHLVMQTSMPLAQIAVACGFSSPAHFARAYRECFAISASQERSKAARARAIAPAHA